MSEAFKDRVSYFRGKVVTYDDDHAAILNEICDKAVAADDLLEALEMVRDADDDRGLDGFHTIPQMARDKIDAAIAKAKGEP